MRLCLQEAVGDTLEELWISYNMIEKLKGINVLKKLKVCHLKLLLTAKKGVDGDKMGCFCVHLYRLR